MNELKKIQPHHGVLLTGEQGSQKCMPLLKITTFRYSSWLLTKDFASVGFIRQRSFLEVTEGTACLACCAAL